MPPFDLAKLVGAASAPVALIIATSIFLGNLTGKYAAMFSEARQLLGEYRKSKDENKPRPLVADQIVSYGRRLQTLIWATFWLGNAILLFIATVILTSLSVLAPNQRIWAIGTTVSMFLGLLLLALAVIMEIHENHLARRALYADLAEFEQMRGDSRDSSAAHEVRELTEVARRAAGEGA